MQAGFSLQSELGRDFCDLLALASLHRFVRAIVGRVQPCHKGHEDLTSSPPSSGLTPAVSLESPTLLAGN